MINDENLDLIKKEEILYIATCVFNPSNYISRYNRYFQFANYISQFDNVRLYTIELAIGNQEFTVTDIKNPNHVQLRTDKSLWYKENILNILFQKLPKEAKHIAWVDCDVQWDNKNWARDTIAALNKYPIVQMFSTWQNLDENDNPISDKPVQSFCYRWVHKTQNDKFTGSTGLAWAARRDILENIGWLIDWGIVGSGDYYMAHALIGLNRSDVLGIEKKDILDPNTFIGAFDRALNQWIEKTEVYVQRNLGYVPGNLRHFFHGKKSERGYDWRWKILVKHRYSPIKNISYRPDGLIQVTNMPDEFFNEVSNYFDSRREDFGLDKKELTIAAE